MNGTFARRLRLDATDAEKHLWRHLRHDGVDGFKFRRQHPLGRHIVDFVCLERKLVIELDGGQHAESTSDPVRTEWLEGEGYKVLRFWNPDVLRDTEGF